MVNAFSTVRFFKLKIKTNVSTTPCVHMLLPTRACSSCLRRFIPQLITLSFQSKSLRRILWCIWPFSLQGNISDAYTHAVLSCIHETRLLIPSTPNHSKCSPQTRSVPLNSSQRGFGNRQILKLPLCLQKDFLWFFKVLKIGAVLPNHLRPPVSSTRSRQHTEQMTERSARHSAKSPSSRTERAKTPVARSRPQTTDLLNSQPTDMLSRGAANCSSSVISSLCAAFMKRQDTENNKLGEEGRKRPRLHQQAQLPAF